MIFSILPKPCHDRHIYFHCGATWSTLYKCKFIKTIDYHYIWRLWWCDRNVHIIEARGQLIIAISMLYPSHSVVHSHSSLSSHEKVEVNFIKKVSEWFWYEKHHNSQFIFSKDKIIIYCNLLTDHEHTYCYHNLDIFALLGSLWHFLPLRLFLIIIVFSLSILLLITTLSPSYMSIR